MPALWADIFPAAEDTLLPITVGVDRGGPSDRIGRHVDHVVSHPNALIGSAQPIGLRWLADKKKCCG